MKKIVVFILLLFMTLTACSSNEQSDVIILFTSDVHCAVKENIGYDGLAAYKNSLKEKNEYVTLVDLGDHVQGDVIGSLSKGEYIIDIMNYLEYDFAILGNHEFDFGLDYTKKNINNFNGSYLGCNITYNGNNTNLLSELKPYEIVSYGDIDIAYIGISTPASLYSSTPTYFMENGEHVYDFYTGENGTRFINKVQDTIDECISKGADYIIGLSHIGSTEEYSPYSSRELIKGTSGFDILLDGHAHVKISSDIINDKSGNDVLLGSVGTAFDAIGQILISSNGNISLTYIDSYEEKDQATTEYLNLIISEFEEELGKTLVTLSHTLKITDENGIRMIKTREMPLGNLIADAYRYIGNTDIGIINAGGIRTQLNEGSFSYADAYKMHPYGNYLVTCKASGQEIIDSLEIAAKTIYSEYVKDGLAYGEEGSFIHVSGLKYDIDTSIESPVVLNEFEEFVKIEGERKVKNVKILQNGVYVDIDPNETYTVSSVNYIIKNGGSSNNLFMDNDLIITDGIFDYQVLTEYLLYLNGDLSSYSDIEGRVNILK